MKGPHERLKYDLRRVWECPACGHCERTGGDTTTLLCGCQRSVAAEARRFMRLRNDGVRRVRPLEETPSSDASLPSAVPLAPPVDPAAPPAAASDRSAGADASSADPMRAVAESVEPLTKILDDPDGPADRSP